MTAATCDRCARQRPDDPDAAVFWSAKTCPGCLRVDERLPVLQAVRNYIARNIEIAEGKLEFWRDELARVEAEHDRLERIAGIDPRDQEREPSTTEEGDRA